MDIKEAFYKQKNELHACQREVRRLQKRFSRKLSFFVEELRSACISSDLIYWDDTVVFIHTARACFRFYGNDRIALYSTHMKKDLAGILEDNILPCLFSTTTVMHDHNSMDYFFHEFDDIDDDDLAKKVFRSFKPQPFF